MVYHKVAEKLEEEEFSSLTAVGLPDGSVDTYCCIEKGEEKFIRSRTEAVKFIKNNPEASLNLIPQRVEPGGKSVNMSIQADSLGAETRHYGFLDHEVFDRLEFETYSMGEPADVTICEFEDGSFLTARIPERMIEWDLKDLKQFPGTNREKFSTDIVNCANHTNIHTMNRELEDIADIGLETEVFNFDPGSLKTVDDSDIKRMFEALVKINDNCEVIVHANSEELKTAARLYDIEGSRGEKLQGVRQKTGINAYILHDKEEAVAGTEEGIKRVENREADQLKTRTGAGDRFDAAVGLARVAGWSWRESLALGNISAVHYLEENRSGSPGQLAKKIGKKF